MSVSETSHDLSQDFEHEPVPLDKRRHWLSITLVWIAIGIDISSLQLGTELANGMSFGAACGSILLGSLMLGVLASMCAPVGARTGLSTPLITERVFGTGGAKILSVIIAISMMGWFGVQAGFFASNIVTLSDATLHTSLDVRWIALLGGLLMMSTAFAFKGMEKLSQWGVPALVLLILAALVFGFKKFGTSGLAVAPSGDALSFGAGTTLVIGIFVLGAVMSPDVARYAKSERDARIATFIGFLVGNSFMLIIAVILVRIMDSEDVMSVFIALGLGIPAILVLTLAQWTTNTSNLYSASLGFAVVFSKVPRIVLTVVVGVVASVAAFLGLFDHFITFLSVMTMLITPMGGVYLAEYYVVRRQQLPDAPAGFVVRALVPWVAGCLLAWSTTPSPDGLGLFSLSAIPALDGFVLAFILHVALGWSQRTTAGSTDGVIDNAEVLA